MRELPKLLLVAVVLPKQLLVAAVCGTLLRLPQREPLPVNAGANLVGHAALLAVLVAPGAAEPSHLLLQQPMLHVAREKCWGGVQRGCVR